MNVSDLGPKVVLRETFSMAYLKRVTSQGGTYVLTNFSGEILYIGVTNNIKRRMKEHLNSEKYSVVTPQGASYWFYYRVSKEEKCFAIERGWLNQVILSEGYFPYFNKISSPL